MRHLSLIYLCIYFGQMGAFKIKMYVKWTNFNDVLNTQQHAGANYLIRQTHIHIYI